jgi:serine/threonine-protein phosphatase 2A regulatory subunit B'
LLTWGGVDVPTSNRQELFIQKLEQCNVIFDFRDPAMDIKSKEIKRSTLQELLEYISNNRNVILPSMYGKIVNMVRPLLPAIPSFLSLALTM